MLIDHEISELAATELVAELAAELAASFTLVKTYHTSCSLPFQTAFVSIRAPNFTKESRL